MFQQLRWCDIASHATSPKCFELYLYTWTSFLHPIIYANEILRLTHLRGGDSQASDKQQASVPYERHWFCQWPRNYTQVLMYTPPTSHKLHGILCALDSLRATSISNWPVEQLLLIDSYPSEWCQCDVCSSEVQIFSTVKINVAFDRPSIIVSNQTFNPRKLLMCDASHIIDLFLNTNPTGGTNTGLIVDSVLFSFYFWSCPSKCSRLEIN